MHDLVDNQHWKTGHVLGQLPTSSLKFCKLAIFCRFVKRSPNDLNGFVCAWKNVAGGALTQKSPHLFVPCLDPNYELNERAAIELMKRGKISPIYASLNFGIEILYSMENYL